MKHHIMLALGLLMAIVFSMKGASAFLSPGLGVADAYAVGGLILAATLIFNGLSEWRRVRSEGSTETNSERKQAS